MDFIDDLPQYRQYNCIMVIVDKLSKYAHFLPLTHPYTTSKVADLFVDTIYRLHGMPQSLVSTVILFSRVSSGKECSKQQEHICVSAQPTIPRQMAKQRGSINPLSVSCVVSPVLTRSNGRNGWGSEFWYNTNWHSSLGKSPFEVIYGRQPRYFGVTASTSIAPGDIQSWLDERTLVIASVRQHLLRMQQRMRS